MDVGKPLAFESGRDPKAYQQTVVDMPQTACPVRTVGNVTTKENVQHADRVEAVPPEEILECCLQPRPRSIQMDSAVPLAPVHTPGNTEKMVGEAPSEPETSGIVRLWQANLEDPVQPGTTPDAVEGVHPNACSRVEGKHLNEFIRWNQNATGEFPQTHA